MDLGLFYHKLIRNHTFFQSERKMSGGVGNTTTTSSHIAAGPAQELAQMAVESLNRSRIDPQTASTMSRRRLFFLQMNSLIICVLTCLTVCAVTLSRITSLPEFLFGACGIVTKILTQNLTDPASLASAALDAATSDPQECKQ
jgi:hypothetical protein